MVGMKSNIKEVVFYKQIGALFNSNEWVCFNIESVATTPDVAQPMGDRPISNFSLQVEGEGDNSTLLLEGYEARITRLVQ